MPTITLNAALEQAESITPLLDTHEVIVTDSTDDTAVRFTKSNLFALRQFFQGRIFEALQSLTTTTNLISGDQIFIQGTDTIETRNVNAEELIRTVINNIETVDVQDDFEFIVENGTQLRKFSVASLSQFILPQGIPWESTLSYASGTLVTHPWTYEINGLETTRTILWRSSQDNNLNNEPPSASWRLAEDIAIPVSGTVTSAEQFTSAVDITADRLFVFSTTTLAEDTLGTTSFFSQLFTQPAITGLGNLALENFELPSRTISFTSYPSFIINKDDTTTVFSFRFNWSMLWFLRNISNV